VEDVNAAIAGHEYDKQREAAQNDDGKSDEPEAQAELTI